jgi:hypothetical protein
MPLLDDFNRANTGPPPSANWTTIINGHKVVSNQAQGNLNGASNISLWNAGVYGPHVITRFQIPTKCANGEYFEVYARMTTLVAGTVDGYVVRFTAVNGSNNDTVQFYRIDNGAYSAQLGATITQEFTTNDWIGIRCIGDQIAAEMLISGIWTTLGVRTDATYAAAGYVGMGVVGTTGRTEDFFAESLEYPAGHRRNQQNTLLRM